MLSPDNNLDLPEFSPILPVPGKEPQKGGNGRPVQRGPRRRLDLEFENKTPEEIARERYLREVERELERQSRSVEQLEQDEFLEWLGPPDADRNPDILSLEDADYERRTDTVMREFYRGRLAQEAYLMKRNAGEASRIERLLKFMG